MGHCCFWEMWLGAGDRAAPGLGSREGLEGRTEWMWQEFWLGVLDRDPGGSQGTPLALVRDFRVGAEHSVTEHSST